MPTLQTGRPKSSRWIWNVQDCAEETTVDSYLPPRPQRPPPVTERLPSCRAKGSFRRQHDAPKPLNISFRVPQPATEHRRGGPGGHTDDWRYSSAKRRRCPFAGSRGSNGAAPTRGASSARLTENRVGGSQGDSPRPARRSSRGGGEIPPAPSDKGAHPYPSHWKDTRCSPRTPHSQKDTRFLRRDLSSQEARLPRR